MKILHGQLLCDPGLAPPMQLRQLIKMFGCIAGHSISKTHGKAQGRRVQRPTMLFPGQGSETLGPDASDDVIIPPCSVKAMASC